MLVQKLLNWAREFLMSDIGFYMPVNVSPVDRARNDSVKHLFEKRFKKDGSESTSFTHIFFVDSDTIPPPSALKTLLSHDKDIISGITPILHYNDERKEWGTLDNCFERIDENAEGKRVVSHAVKRNTGLVEIERCGTSCLLIKKEVFEKLEKPYFKFVYNEDGTKHELSEDLYFCDKAREAGYKIWCDTSVICNHFKEIML